MIGVILAGGVGSRLSPMTDVTNKHLLPVGPLPMIYHAIYKLREIGITTIIIVTSIDHCGTFSQALGQGKNFNCQFVYVVQQESDGIAGALGLCKNIVKDQHMCVILGDNIFSSSLDKYVSFTENKILLYPSETPQRFGVAEISDRKLIRIHEKPTRPISSRIVTGIYFYKSEVFDYISKCTLSSRGEYEITDVNNMLINDGKLTYDNLLGFYSDAGTYDSYQEANKFMWSKQKQLLSTINYDRTSNN